MTNIRSNTRYHVMANMNMVYDAMAFFADIGFVQAVLSFVVRLRRYVNAPGVIYCYYIVSFS